MLLKPFLLDHWLNQYEFAVPPITYNLAASTGPGWALQELMGLGGGTLEESLGQIRMGYAPPEGSFELRSAIADFYSVNPDWVVVTTGASEALSILFCLAAGSEANVVLPSPGFPAFDAVAEAWRLTQRHYFLDLNASRQCHQDILAAVDEQTLLVLVNTPHNPTGAIMRREELEPLAKELVTRRIPLIVDEVYHPLYFGDAVPSAAGLDNVILVSDMSKAFSLPGLRMGWIIDSDPERRRRIIDARSYFTISASPLLEAIAIHALSHRTVLLERLNTVAKENFVLLCDFMDTNRRHLSWAQPGGGTVAFPRFRNGRSTRAFCKLAADQGVLVVPGDCFDQPAHFRIGICAQPSGYAMALNILGQVVDQAVNATME